MPSACSGAVERGHQRDAARPSSLLVRPRQVTDLSSPAPDRIAIHRRPVFRDRQSGRARGWGGLRSSELMRLDFASTRSTVRLPFSSLRALTETTAVPQRLTSVRERRSAARTTRLFSVSGHPRRAAAAVRPVRHARHARRARERIAWGGVEYSPTPDEIGAIASRFREVGEAGAMNSTASWGGVGGLALGPEGSRDRSVAPRADWATRF
jgi:hypothetical protein